MRAASRALVALLTAGCLLTVAPTPASAAPGEPACPVAIADLPLSVAIPFSGTPRPVAGEDGDIDSISLLCAYGEGVEPSAQIRLEWSPTAATACGDTTTVVAAGLDEAAFTTAADDLATELGGPCPPDQQTSFPTSTAAIAAGLGAVAAAVALARRSRAHRPSGPKRQETLVVSEGGLRPEEAAGGRPPPSDERTLAGAPARRLADLRPVIEQLQADDVFARSTSGQLVAVAAIAHGTGNEEAAELARAAIGTSRRPARADLAVLAEALAHQPEAVDR